MPVVLRRNQLAYFPVPKVACTSIKQMLYTVQHGRRFEPKILPSGEKVFIHSLYRAIPFKRLDPAEFEGCRRIAVVRDPVRRILSAYRNRVLHLRELSVEKAGKRLAAAGLPADPDLDTFVDLFEAYREAVPTIRHHTRGQVDFLGSDPAFLDRIYRFSELETLAQDIRALTGTDVELPWLQKGGHRLPLPELTPAQVAKLRDFYAADYAVLGAWFD